MATEWRNITLGDFVTIQRGHDLTSTERREGKVPVLGAAGQNGFHDTAIAKGPGIVIGRCGGSYGQVHYCEDDFWPHNTGLYVTDFKGNDQRFAFYLLKLLNFDSYNSGSAQPSLNRNFIYPIPIRVPLPAGQKSISGVLTALDDKIELNQRINEELERMAKLLYDYWFVQFDFPMTAAQAAALGKPKLAGHPYRASGGRMVWSQELKREVPEDWRVGNLGELCDIFDGPHATPTKTESGPYYLSISSLENGRLDLTKSARLSEAEFVKWTRRVTPTAGDVLFSYETRLGEAALMPAEIRACLGRRMGLLRPKRDQVSPAFLLQSYLSQAFQGVIRSNVIQGATVERISLNDLPSFPMLIPALEQREAASKILTPLHGKIAQNQRQTQELTALRDWLLPMLMNGQVTVG
jgi:type I restriction enzyme S subunit